MKRMTGLRLIHNGLRGLVIGFVGMWLGPATWGAVLVYDGFPVTGTGAYSMSTCVFGQNPTHASIIGETGTWTNANNATTAVLTNSLAGLSYPAGINLSPQSGGMRIFSTASGGSNVRAIMRAITPVLAGKSFYFSALAGFNDLSSLANNEYVAFGLVKTRVNNNQYPPADGIQIGFKKNGSNIDAILRVLGTTYPLQASVPAGTYFFVVKLDYNASGNDTVYAALNPSSSEPSTWATNVSAEVLTSSTNFGFVYAGGNYGVNSKYAEFDEWRVGDTYADVAGSSEAPPLVTTLAATNVQDTSGWMNGRVTSTGSADTVVSVFHGTTDAGTNGAWDATNTFAGTVSSVPQDFSLQVSSLSPWVRYYYRFAASNSVGFSWATASTNFLPQPVGLPLVTNAVIGSITKTNALFSGSLSTASPPATVYACWDTADRGVGATGDWAHVALVGTYAAPTNLATTLGGLLANGSYACRFFSTNDQGGVWSGPAATFTTPVPQITISDGYGYEGNSGTTSLSLTVNLDVPSAQAVTFNYATSNGTALAGTGYVATNGAGTIGAGATSTSLTFEAIGNTVEEFPGRNFWVNLSGSTGASQATAVVTAEAGILDDDLGSSLFSDGFEDGNDDGWTRLTNSSAWTVATNLYSYPNGSYNGNNQAGDTNWGEYGLRVMARIGSTYKTTGIRTRAQGASEPDGGYAFTFENTGSGLSVYGAWLKCGTNVLLSTGAVTSARLSTTVLHPVSMRVQTLSTGTWLRCYVDMTKIFDYVDTNSVYPHGMIGLVPGAYSYASFDNVDVYAAPSVIEPSASITLAATDITGSTAWLNGRVTSTGTAATVVSVFHGTTDAGTNGAWDGTNTFAGTVSTVPQDYSWQVSGLTPNIRYYYRYAASNGASLVWSPTSTNFLPQIISLPAITGMTVTVNTKSNATFTGSLITAAPPVTVFACWDSSDRGMASTGAWAHVAYVGAYDAPASLSCGLSNLLACGNYACRFYATNDVGPAWSDPPVNFSVPKPLLTVSDAYVNEGNSGLTPLVIAINLDAVSLSNVTVNFATSNGLAVAGTDYVASNGTVVIAAGTVGASLGLSVVGNGNDDFPGKNFWVNFSGSVGASQATTVVKAEAGILDDDFGQRIFRDDFEDGNDSGWLRLTNSSAWTVAPNLYSYYGNGNGNNQAGDLNWGDYGLRVMMRIASDWQAAGIRVRAQGGDDPEGGYTFFFLRNDIGQMYNGWLKIGTNTVLSTTPLNTPVPNTRLTASTLRPAAMRVKNVSTGVWIRCYSGFTKIFDYVDTNSTCRNGMIGLVPGSYSHSYYDDVEVFALPAGAVYLLR